MCMLFNTVSRTGPGIRHDIACSLKLRMVDGVSFAEGTHITRKEKVEGSFLELVTCPTAIPDCSSGTKSGVKLQ